MTRLEAPSEAGFYPAVEGLLKARFPRVYRRLAVPARPTYPYQVVTVTLGRGIGYMQDGTHSQRAGSITVHCWGNSDEGARAAAEAATGALLDQKLQVEGWRLTPCRLALDPAVTDDPDDQGVAGLILSFTFTARPLAQEA